MDRRHGKTTERASRIVMIGPEGARGGIASVLASYLDAGFPDSLDVTMVASTAVNGIPRKLAVFAAALVRVVIGLLRREWDIAHIHASQGASFIRKSIMAALCHAGGLKVIFHAHGSRFDDALTKGPAWRRRLAAATLSRADLVIVLSEEWRTVLSELVPDASFAVVQNGVRLPSQPASLEGNLVVSTGILGTRKGSYTMVKALVDVPEATMVLAGNGEVEQVRMEAERLGVAARAATPGWLDGDERDDLLRNAAVYALPSQAEGLPMGLLEAMSFGLPVVTTPVGGIPGMIRDGENGLLVQPDDPEGTARALRELLADLEFRRRIGTSARATVESGYTTGASLARLETIYSELT